MAIPSLLFVFTSYAKGNIISKIFTGYNFLIISLISILTVADMELYTYWGFRIDKTPLLYIATPKEAMASISIFRIVLLTLFIASFIWGCSFVFKKYIKNQILKIEKSNLIVSALFLVLTASLIIPIRGGVGVATMNASSVYFHKNNNFANHAAINPIWNVAHSLLKKDKNINPYIYTDISIAKSQLHELYLPKGETTKLLNTDKPNVILIILESFTSKIIKDLGGKDSVTPNFNKFVHEGVLFSNIYANGDRSDKGIVAVLSGFPSFPQKSIIKYPKKTQKLPFMSKDFNKLGYNTAFYYGGDIDFASMRSYFITGGFNSIVSKDDFDKKYHKSKWGVHDHLVFDRLYNDINNVEEPFFYSYFTLSSHEPFEVPMETVIKGNTDEAMYLNSANYTDKSLGDFIEKAKTQPWWDNTLVICIADHGIRHPGNTHYSDEDKFKIPMLWLGGALNTRDTVISKHGAQTDLVSTLLGQINVENKEYIYSKDLLNSNSNSFSYYVFNNGFNFITDSSIDRYDNVSKKLWNKEGADNLDKGKALLQVSFQDFLDK